MHPFPSCLQALPLSLRALLGSTALLSAIATSAPAAQAIGFLNLDSGSWTGALECPIPGESLNCVENITASTVTLVGPDTEGSFLIYISQPVPVGDPGYTIGFDYAFNSSPFQEAFYMVGSQSFTLDSTGGSFSSIDSISLLPEQSFSFSVGNTDTLEVALLDISDFTATPVPGPLPCWVPLPPSAGAGACARASKPRLLDHPPPDPLQPRGPVDL